MDRQPIPQHVWVDLTCRWVEPSPGVLLWWRKNDRGWRAWVIYASTHSTGHGLEVDVRQGWMLHNHVRPAGEKRTPETLD